MKKLVIFDLDGTLLNTIDDLAHAANHALTQCGFPTHEISSYPFFVGNGVGRLLERVLPVDHRDAATVARVREIFQGYYDRHLYDYTRPYPGIEDLLYDLATKGVKFAVASNKYQAATSALIAHFFPRLPFEAVHGMRPGIPAKPDPSIVFGVLRDVPTPKADVIYVGDSGIDMETARRACLASVGVTWGFRPIGELRQFLAENIISEPSQLLPLIS
ncbi:MAG: HAD family hydrolase [Bacteroides sp.]|nr:HAD family hydrolase [Bacteroides sp.]MCM1379257.1 HAD family hydrolase [Bacteroides sp.]MCM1445085.1 HAD family hydrolase [Prevotella sp.]